MYDKLFSGFVQKSVRPYKKGILQEKQIDIAKLPE